MKFYVLLLYVLMTNVAHSQCNLQEDKTAEFLKIAATPEYLFKNEDLENGVQLITGNVSYLIDANNLNEYLTTLTIKYAYSGNKVELVPREVQITMGNGKTMFCKAKNMTEETHKGIKVIICNFTLLPHEAIDLKTNTTSSITILDTRTNIKKVVTPYQSLFKEQLECVDSMYFSKLK